MRAGGDHGEVDRLAGRFGVGMGTLSLDGCVTRIDREQLAQVAALQHVLEAPQPTDSARSLAPMTATERREKRREVMRAHGRAVCALIKWVGAIALKTAATFSR